MTVRQTSLQSIQFGQQYDGEKARRLMEEIIKLQGALNNLVSQFNSLSTDAIDAAALQAAIDALHLDQLALNDLTDVDTTGAGSDQVLIYNGSQWVPSAVPGFSGLGSLAYLEPGFLLTARDGQLDFIGRHTDLPNLDADDHPQYTEWAAAESITAQWQWSRSLWGPNGTALLPAYTHTSDPTTGTYLIAAGQLGVTEAGVQTMRLAYANPTGLIGLTAVNGTSLQPTRSDARHAIDQAIEPVWTGKHLFTADNFTTSATSGVAPGVNSGGNPQVTFIRSASAANTKQWRIAAGTNNLAFTVATDAGLDQINHVFLNAFRTGLAISDIQHGNTTDNPTHSFLGTGAATFGGTATVTGTFSGLAATNSFGANGNTGAVLQLNAATATSKTVRFYTAGSLRWFMGADANAESGSNAGSGFQLISFTDAGASLQTALIVLRATGCLQGVNGTAAAPTWTYQNDTDCGWYRIGANNIGAAVNGAKVLDVATTGLTVTGTSTANSFIPTSATLPTNGLYLPATNDIGFATNGVLRWDVSTTAITSTLPSIGQDGTVGAPSWSFSSDTDIGMYRIGANNLGFAVNGANAIDIDVNRTLFATPPRVPSYTVAGLPAAATVGQGSLAMVTDSTLTTITGLGLAPTGGGANKVPVYSDGTNWLML